MTVLLSNLTMAKSKWDKKNWSEKLNSVKDLAEHYNINPQDYPTGGAYERFGIGKGGVDELRDAVIREASNDYDLRNSIANAASLGNKKAQNILDKGFDTPGDKGIKNIFNATKFMKKTHKNRMDLGGEFTDRDEDHVTQYWQDRAYGDLIASASRNDSDGSEDPSDFSADRPYELSPELNAAIDRNRDFAETRLAGEIFRPLRSQPTEGELIAASIVEADQEKQDRENQFLFDFITDMNLG